LQEAKRMPAQFCRPSGFNYLRVGNILRSCPSQNLLAPPPKKIKSLLLLFKLTFSFIKTDGLVMLKFTVNQYCIKRIDYLKFYINWLPLVCCLQYQYYVWFPLPAPWCLLSFGCCLLSPTACCLLSAACCYLSAISCLLYSCLLRIFFVAPKSENGPIRIWIRIHNTEY